MKKFLIIMSFLALIALPASAKDFSDVTDETYYSDSIMWMANNGVINGDAAPKTTFRPDDCVNRAEMLKMLFEATGEDLENMAMGGLYPDVPSDAWYSSYVKKATLKGVVQGYPDGNFRPEQCVNRAEAMKMGINEFGIDLLEEDEVSNFGDIDTGDWYAEFANTSLGRGLVGVNHVYSDASSALYYSPAAYMTRKEAAEMLYRMKTVVDNDLNTYGLYYEPNPIIRDFVNEEYAYGQVSVMGYIEVDEDKTDPRCDPDFDDCEIVDYVWFYIYESDNDYFTEFLKDNEGNAFTDGNRIGLGCLTEDHRITYYNASDYYGHEELTMDQKVSEAILNSQSDSPITIKLTKYLLSAGSGAPLCYAHFRDVELPY
ncbi:hypothetical protein GF354_01670 [Candidatus Peregrinibacteria bacterium]|nr:hypothetical protein [Candidatus Peregrinibacteria bacterium]